MSKGRLISASRLECEAGTDISSSVTFWKRYRVRLHVTSKAVSGPNSMDLEALAPDHPIIQPPPQLVHHSRLGSRNSRWAYQDRRYQRPVSEYQYGSYRIGEEPETGTVAHHLPYSAPTIPATFVPAPAITTPATVVGPEAATPYD